MLMRTVAFLIGYALHLRILLLNYSLAKHLVLYVIMLFLTMILNTRLLFPNNQNDQEHRDDQDDKKNNEDNQHN